MVKILVVEPDAAVAQSIELMLKAQRFTVYTTNLGAEAIDLARLYDYDVMTLELNLPDMSGFDVIRKLAIAKCKTPILVVSNRKRIEDIVTALNAGAADYMPKPFHANELAARILALVRRCNDYVESRIEIGPIVLDLHTCIVTVFDVPIRLTRSEYTMLEIMMLRAGRTLSQDALLNHMYDGVDDPKIKIIDVFVCRLRTKLAAAGAPNLIKTIWGRGYTIDPQLPTLRECLANA
jgi:two-component system cell cycle response regulator CtrA